MQITSKYNVNDRIVVKVDNATIITTIQRIEIVVNSTCLEIKYKCEFGLFYEDSIITIDQLLTELSQSRRL